MLVTENNIKGIYINIVHLLKRVQQDKRTPGEELVSNFDTSSYFIDM